MRWSILIFLLFSSSNLVCVAQDLLEIPTKLFLINENVKEGDVIYGDESIRAEKNIDESLSIQLEGSNPSAIAIKKSIIDSSEPIVFVLVNRKALLETPKHLVKIQAIGVISGKFQEEQIEFRVETSSRLPQIQNVPNLVVRNDFEAKETAILKMSSEVPSEAEIQVVGKYSERIQANFEKDNIIITTVPCEENENCHIKFPFSLLLILKIDDADHVETVLNFEDDKKSQLKMEQKIYETTIEEHTGEQEKLLRISAKGNSSEILYSLRDSSGLFSIHPTEGILSILHPEFLTISSFGDVINLTSVATDGENTVKAIVKVRLVPHIQKDVIFGFDKEEYEIEGEMMAKIIGNIAAKSDDDHELIYRISEGRADLYNIAPNGDIEYIGAFEKQDREDQINVIVQDASGGLRLSSAKCYIHLKGVGSNLVKFEGSQEGLETISEDDAVGVVVSSIQFSDDDVDAKLEFEISASSGFDANGDRVNDASQLFDVKSDEKNQAHIVIAKELSSTNMTTVRVDVIARDITHPKEPETTVRRIVIIERNIEKSITEELNLINLPSNISIPMDSPIGSMIYQARIMPKINSKAFKFTIEPQNLFDILENGTIINRVSLMHETTKKIPLRISVSDGIVTRNAETSLLLLKKARKSHFTEPEYFGRIPKLAGSVVALVMAKDSNDEPINNDFVLKGGHAKYFTIDSQGTIMTSEEILNTKQNELDFLVALSSDPSISAPVHVVLEEKQKDRIELEENQVFATVYDNLPINSFVAKIVAIDNEDVKFEMSSDDKKLSKIFFIDDDGTVRNSEFLTGLEGINTFSINVTSIDKLNIGSANASLIIDILKSRDCVPKFKQDENLIFYAREKIAENTLIGKVMAEKLPDHCNLKFSLWDSISNQAVVNNQLLVINSENGEIRTAKEFDYEKQKSYMIILLLSAGRHHSTMTTSELKIIDVDDHLINFDQKDQYIEVSEDTPPASVITTIRAMDNDDQPIFYHLGSSSPPQFSLHSTTGQIIVEELLDREKESSYLILVGASNSPSTSQSEWPTSMRLHITIKDVNDNGPIFEKSNYESVIDKDVVVGTGLIEVHASDPDIDDQTKKLEYSVSGTSFEYRGMSRTVDDVIDIKPFDGIVYTHKSLRNYVGGVFHVQLQVRDTVDGTIGKSWLKVYVHDMSDLLTMELPYKPTDIDSEIVNDFMQQLSNSTQLLALSKSVVYKSSYGMTSQNSVELQFIFFNKTSSEILPAEKALAIFEKTVSHRHSNLPEIRRLTATTSNYEMKKGEEETRLQPALLLIFIGFFVLLAIVLSLCALLACVYRSKYQRAKTVAENSRVIQDSIKIQNNRSPALISFKHYPSPTPEIQRPIPNGDDHIYRSPKIEEETASYAIQQATIIVAEHEEKI